MAEGLRSVDGKVTKRALDKIYLGLEKIAPSRLSYRVASALFQRVMGLPRGHVLAEAGAQGQQISLTSVYYSIGNYPTTRTPAKKATLPCETHCSSMEEQRVMVALPPVAIRHLGNLPSMKVRHQYLILNLGYIRNRRRSP